MKSFLSLLSGFVMIVGMVGAAGAGDQDAAIRAGGWTTLLLQFAMIGENLFGRDSSARWPLAGWKESFEETLARLAFSFAPCRIRRALAGADHGRRGKPIRRCLREAAYGVC